MTAIRTRTAVTQRDLEVLRFVRQYREQHGHAPTRAEIAERLGFSRPTAEGHLQALKQLGYVVLRTEWRGIYPTRKAAAACGATR